MSQLDERGRRERGSFGRDENRATPLIESHICSGPVRALLPLSYILFPPFPFLFFPFYPQVHVHFRYFFPVGGVRKRGGGEAVDVIHRNRGLE